MSPSSSRLVGFVSSFRSLVGLVLVTAWAGIGCGSSSAPGGMANPVVDLTMQDSHCTGVAPQPVSAASCHPPASDAGVGADDGGTDDAGGGGAPEFGDTMYNTEGDDDDCKYHVKYAVKPATDGNVTFTITVTKLAAPGPATGAVVDAYHGVSVQAFLASNEFHVAPNTNPMTAATETQAGSGIYTITPVKLDQSGRWVVRFHFFETCEDTFPDSPHGHAAFFVDVP